MSVRYALGIVVGLDAEDAKDAKGKSVLDRYREGDLPYIQDDSDGSTEAFEEWWATEAHALGGADALEVFGAGSAQHTGVGRVIIGSELARVNYEPRESSYAGPVRRADLAKTAEEVQEALKSLGITTEPRIYLRNNVA